MATFKQTYTTAQINTDILTPGVGNKVFVWNVLVETDSPSGTQLDFNISSISICNLGSAGEIGIQNVNKEGASDEALTLNCGTGTTTVTVLYDEL